MTALRTHFLDRYFGYRRLYVDAILSRAPHRAALAVLSEIARLAFVIFGCVLVALIFWLLTAGAAQRAGGLGLWPAVFGACAATASLLALTGVVATVRAAGDIGRVRRAAGAPPDRRS